MTRVERTHPGMNYQQEIHGTHTGQQGELIKEVKLFATVRWDNGKTEELYKGDIKKI